MKTKITSLIAIVTFAMISFTSKATNVSGGIYVNTTWTLANSPYIVTDTVVVFPGVTLTIEPGVVVKFDANGQLELRQARLYSVGTVTDSITFTSNSGSPIPGIWWDIECNGGTMNSQFIYCKILYAHSGIYDHGVIGNIGTTAIEVNHSRLTNNITGIQANGNGGGFIKADSSIFSYNTKGFNGAQYKINYCNINNNQSGIYIQPFSSTFTYINNSSINLNQVGITGNAATGASFYSIRNSVIDCNTVAGIVEGDYTNYTDTIFNSLIKNNPIGVLDSFGGGLKITKSIIENNIIGLKLKESNKTLDCNKICNIEWDIYCKNSFANNLNMPNNYWCTNNSGLIPTKIYDGYDNINLSLINFIPIDTFLCYSTGVINPFDTSTCSGVGCNLFITTTSVNATCGSCPTGSATATIINGMPPYTYTWYSAPIQTTQTATGLSSGWYTICVTDANSCSHCDSVFVDSTNCTGFSVTTNATNATCSSCNDGTAMAIPTGGTGPYNYTWYTIPMQSTDSISSLTQGTYAVCITDANGCTVCDSATVGIGSCSAHFNLYADTIPQHYLAVNMASGALPLTYNWSWGDGTFSTTAFPSHTYANSGFYTICLSITDNVGCTNTYCSSYYLLMSQSPMVYVNVISPLAVGIAENVKDESLIISPNPFTSQTTITFNSEQKNTTIKIKDVLGKEIKSVNFSGKQCVIDKGEMENGIYFVQIMYFDRLSMTNHVVNRKIIVQ